VNVVDSSGWIEYFVDTPQAGFFARAIEDTASLVVPTISLYEVTKIIRREQGPRQADEAAALMTAGIVVDLTVELALLASTYALPMADSIIYATAQKNRATLWTQDELFKGLPGVRFQTLRKE
jgi:predicted nucleic acid-binding protein